MLNTLKQTGKTLGRELTHAWGNLSEGWRELLNRSSDALTQFTHRGGDGEKKGGAVAPFPRWGLLAGELEETRKDVVVRLELPGIDKTDCQITIEGNLLRVHGEKRLERDARHSTYHVMERAYGVFERTIVLPRNVDIDLAEATYKDGVLTVRLPKAVSDSAKSIAVT
jgi:HSP20 family protein